MGAQVSSLESTTNVVVNSIMTVCQNYSKKCSDTATAINNISLNLSGSSGVKISGIDQSNMVQINFTCLNESASSNDFTNTLKEQIQKDLESNLSGLSGVLSDSSIKTKINTVVNTASNVSISDMQSCFANNSSSNEFQVVAVGSKNVSITNITQSNALTIVAKCVQSSSALQTASSDLDTAVTEKSTSTIAGIDIAALLSSYWWALVACVGICACVCIVSSIVSLLSTKSFSSSPQQMDVVQPMDVSSSSSSSNIQLPSFQPTQTADVY